MSLPSCKKCRGQIIYSEEIGVYLCIKCDDIPDTLTIPAEYFEK